MQKTESQENTEELKKAEDGEHTEKDSKADEAENADGKKMTEEGTTEEKAAVVEVEKTPESTEPTKNIEKTVEEEIPDAPPKRQKRKIGRKIIAGLVFAVAALSVLFCKSMFWMLDTWNNLSMEELVFHLKAPLEGTDSGIIKDYIVQCLLVAVVVLAALLVLRMAVKRHRRLYIGMLLMMLCLAVGGDIWVGAYVWDTLDISTYYGNQGTYSTFIDDNYVDPGEVKLEFPEKKRNLIYIFLESMETTYADEKSGGAFERNVIPELTQLAEENEDFSGTEQKLNGGLSLTGTTWTVGAMVAQTSGLPLVIPIDGNAMNTQESFYPGVVTLGDILADEGYEQILLLGSEAIFGGRELYFEEHGGYEMYDYNYSIETGEIPEDYHVWWGYEDKLLFTHAKEHLTELAETGKPFNLTMLTVDTHFEDGYVCSECRDTFGDDQYANVMACSSRQVYEFVKWVQEQPFYEDTTIVISGDHLTMDKNFCDDVKKSYDRKVYTAYINSAVSARRDDYREYTTFDNFPTTLASMGVKIRGDRLGLGTNLFSERETLTERYGREVEDQEIAKKSRLMEDFNEGVETVKGSISVTPYQEQTGAFGVEVSQVRWKEEIGSVEIDVWTDEEQTDLQRYHAEKDSEGVFRASVPVNEFSSPEGEYTIHVYANLSDGTQMTLGEITESITLGDSGQLPGEETAAQTIQIAVSPYDYRVGYFEVTISGVQPGVQSIQGAVWSDQEQGDLHWYGAENGGDGTYRFRVYASDFNYQRGSYQIHIYGINEAGDSVLLGAGQGEI